MVVSLDPQDCLYLVEQFFKDNFKEFFLIKKTSYTGYWWLEYVNNSDIRICFDGDIGGHFYIKIFIGDSEFNLWQFDRSVNGATNSTKANILYQLSVLKSFLKDTENFT